MRRWAFSIWGVIFVLEGVGTVYQLMPHGYTPDGWKQRIVNSVGAWGGGGAMLLQWGCVVKNRGSRVPEVGMCVPGLAVELESRCKR